MPTKAEILAELERRKNPAAPAAPVAKPPADAIRAELARRAAQPNVAPMGGKGEFDPKAFAGLNVIQPKPLHDGNDAINAGIEEAAALVPGGYANFQKQPPDPARMQAMGYVQDPLAKGGYAKPAQPDAFATIKNNPSDNNLLTDIGRAASAPFQQNENVRSAAGVPIAFGHGLGQGWQALANNAMALGTDATNSVIQTANPNATPLERPRVSLFDRNALLDEGGLLQSDTNAIPQAMGQFASVRGPIGKFSKGGGFGNMAAKDAAAFALSTEHTAPRLSDMISSNTPVLGPIADLLRSNENDPAIVSMMKNLGEDLSISALTAGILGLVDKSLSVVRPGAANSGTDPRLDPAVAAQIKRVLAKEPVDPAMPTNALASPKPFSASAVPAAGNIVRRNADRIVTGGIGATIGGASDAFAAPGDGGGDGEGGPPIGAGIGAGIGIFGPRAAASAASRGFRAAARPFRPVGFDERVAARAVRNALKSGGITTPEQAAAAMTARFGEKPASVADLTQEGVGTAAGLSRLPGATGEAARARGEDLLQNRAGRLEGDIAQANPSLNPAAIAGDVDRMVQLAQEQATPAYTALRARYPLGSIVSDRLEQLRGLDILAPHLRGVDRYRETLAATEGRVVGDFEYWDTVKRSLDDTEQAAVARNQPVPYDLDSTRQAIVQEMDRLVPDYPAARELGGEAPKMRDAFKQGQALLGGRYTAEDVSRLIQGITGQQLTAAQAGVIRSMVSKTEGARGAMASLMSTGARRKLAQVFGPEAADAMQARFAADAAIVNNAHRINPNVGSVTSQAQLGGGIGPMVADAIRAVRSPAEAALAALSRSGSYSQAQRDLMGQMLLDGVTPENLERIFRSRTPRGPRPAPGGPAVPPTSGGAGPAGGAPRPRGPRPAPSEEAVLSAMAQVNQLAPGRPAPRGPMGPPVREAMWNGPVPSKPQSLLAWIRSQGGINDTNYMTGDLTAIMGRANGMPGLLNRKSGQGLDDLAAAAYHQGFDVNPDDANSLVRLIEEEFGGNPNYRLGAKEEWDAYQETLRARRGPLPGETSSSPAFVGGAAIGALGGAAANPDDPGKGAVLGAIGGGVVGYGAGKLAGRPKALPAPKPPKPPVPKAPVAFKRDPALANLSPGDMVAYIEAKYPRGGNSPSSPSPYWDAATALKRANGDRAAAAAELQRYADYLKSPEAKATAEQIKTAERTVRAVADVDPIFFDDAAFNASMKGRIEAGGTSAMEQIRGATADDGIGGAMDVANRADDMLPGERPIAPRGKPAPKAPTRQGMGINASGAGAAGGGILGYALNPADANGDGVIDDLDRGLNGFGGMVSGGIAGKALGSRAAGKFGNRMKGPPKFRAPDAQTFGGVNAKTADRAALGRAQNMEAEGASRDDIWDATGWFKGVDGKWRFEIDDSTARLRSNEEVAAIGDSMVQGAKDLEGRVKQSNLALREQPDLFPAALKRIHADMRKRAKGMREKANENFGPTWNEYNGRRLEYDLDHPAMIAAYPQLARDLVISRPGPSQFSPGLKGSYTDNRIKLNGPRNSDQTSTTLHETQHALQEAEGFATGGSPESAYMTDGLRQEWAQEIDKILTPAPFEKFAANSVFDGVPEAEVRRQYKAMVDEMRAASKDIYHPLSKTVQHTAAYNIYKRLAGETEARNVQTRRDFTPEERRARRPWETQDVPDDQQIVRFGSGKAESRPKPPPNRLASGPQKGKPSTLIANTRATKPMATEFPNISIDMPANGNRGRVSVKSGDSAGEITFERNERGDFVIKESGIDPDIKGTGLGIQMYEALAQRAAQSKRALYSDSLVSGDAVKIYMALKRRGYNVRLANPKDVWENPNYRPSTWDENKNVLFPAGPKSKPGTMVAAPSDLSVFKVTKYAALVGAGGPLVLVMSPSEKRT